MPKHRLIWGAQPTAEDLAAARRYLSLVFPDAQATRLARALRSARAATHVAKDLLRASGLPLLAEDELHVTRDLRRIHKGKALSPVLLVQGNLSHSRALVIADGYHRICAVCYYDEDAPIACRLVALD
jgi:phosphatidylserine/phosphatidylglycerophosphate/cardiolipin synthase-like enzyme